MVTESMEVQSQSIDHEEVRAVGEAMAQEIGALALPDADRESILETLNAYADEVPYEELFEEDTLLAEKIDAATVDHRHTDENLRVEILRLNSLARSFGRKMPSKHEAAKAAAEQKKEEARQLAEAEKARADIPRKKLEKKREELTDTIDSVSAAWPVAPYSQEVLEAVAALREEEAAKAAEALAEAEEEFDDDVTEEATPVTPEPIHVEERVAGRYAELAESIPSLRDRLQQQVSEHVHVYDGIETAHETAQKAAAKDEGDRTEEEHQLLKAIYVLRHRYLEKANRTGFLEVYGAEDIIELAERLHAFSAKNRPDFDDLEGRILEKAAALPNPLSRRRDVPQSIRDATDRMDQDAEGRTGMTWASLTKFAQRACDTMREKFFAGGLKNVHLKNYVIDVADHTGTKPDLSWVYQFVVDEFAFEKLGERRTERQATVQDHFMKNCDIIAAWAEEAKPFLEQIPSDFRLRRQVKGRRFRFQRNVAARFESLPAPASIRNVIKDIRIRRDGNGDPKALRQKPMRLDPVGALNHQLRLGHMIDALKEELWTYDVATEGHTEEITPFA